MPWVSVSFKSTVCVNLYANFPRASRPKTIELSADRAPLSVCNRPLAPGHSRMHTCFCGVWWDQESRINLRKLPSRLRWPSLKDASSNL